MFTLRPPEPSRQTPERQAVRALHQELGLTNVAWTRGDVRPLPFADRAFTLVTARYAFHHFPDPAAVLAEMTRVCAPGGTIAMANWTPSGFVGQMFKAIARFIAPANMPSPLLWGDEAIVRERLGSGVAQLNVSRRPYTFNYPFPPSEVVDVFRLYYGPANLAFSSLEAAGRQALHQELESLWSAHNRAKGGVTIVDAEYLDVIATRA